jgi:tRNA G18 (ribose-2'-O)-methylase SpoU
LQHFHWPKDDAPARQLPLIIADLQGEPLNATFHWPRHFILALGNEGSGVGTVLRSSAHHRVTISHAAEVESLNVSGAAHILLYSADQWLSKST